jgi:hypothetical protein
MTSMPFWNLIADNKHPPPGRGKGTCESIDGALFTHLSKRSRFIGLLRREKPSVMRRGREKRFRTRDAR